MVVVEKRATGVCEVSGVPGWSVLEEQKYGHPS